MRAAVYVRVSTDKPEQKDSLVYQKQYFEHYIKEKGWEIYDFYVDVKTGTVENRDGFKKMLEDAQKGVFDIILAKESSRLARNQGLSMRLKELLENNSIHLITMDGAINTLKGETQMFGLYAWVYEQEAQRTSDRVKATLTTRAKNGLYKGSNPPYGYTVKDGKLYIADDETPEIVRRIYREYLEGKGFDAIARGLYNDGIRTPSQVANKRNQSPLWHGSTVRMILENPHYTGDLVQGRTETISVTNKKRKINDSSEYIKVENTHEKIIDKEDFKAVKSLILSRRRTTANDTKKCSRPHMNVNLFTGLIYCEDCGRGFHFKKNRRGYICGRYDKHGKKACSAKLIIENELIDIIKNDLKKISGSLSDAEVYSKLKERLSNNRSSAEKELKTIENKIESIAKFKANALEKFISEQITKTDYDLVTGSKDKELNRLKERKELVLKELNDEVDERLLNKLKSELDEKLGFDNINREVLNRFVEKIIVSDEGTVKIYYKFNGSEKIMKELMG
jgi:site-specific DNA recombinase